MPNPPAKTDATPDRAAPAPADNLVTRPLWRAFTESEIGRAGNHAKAGGVAVVKPPKGSWLLLGDAGPSGEPVPLFVDWAIRAIEASRWSEIVSGPAKGCVQAAITKAWRRRVDEWIARDAAFAGATSASVFDCMECGACCFDNHVVLDEPDLLRLKEGGLLDSIKRSKGSYVLPLLPKTKGCVHLRGLQCGIYPYRPSMCRDFPAGSEQCMTSREDKYGGAFRDRNSGA